MRRNFQTLRGLGCAAVIAAGVCACALSPQTVHVDPQLAATAPAQTSAGIRISLSVADTRTTQIIGYRGGVYDTASLTAERGLEDNIRKAVTGAYQAAGFTVLDAGQAGDVRLRVELTELQYAVEGGNFVRGVSLAAAVRAVSESDARTLTANYRETLQKDLLKAPTAQDNERLINEVLAKALNRLVADQRLTSPAE